MSPSPIRTTYPDILTKQHERGREVTEYILSVTKTGTIGARGPALAGALAAFVRMYTAHAAAEDTIVFPAWKETFNEKQYEEISVNSRKSNTPNSEGMDLITPASKSRQLRWSWESRT